MRFQDQVVIVTGAGGGIGRAIASAFAEEGADIVIPDIDHAAAEETAETVRQLGRRALVIDTDVSDSAAVRAAIAGTLETFGHVDVVVNNAGISLHKQPYEYTDEEWHKIIGVNLNGVWFFCRYILDHFLGRGRGNIVNVASVGAIQTSYRRAPYMASKGAIVSLTKALATDLASKNIRVNAVAPWMTVTGLTNMAEKGDLYPLGNYLTHMGRWGEPHEVAKAVLFLASGDASYVTGHVLCVDGGALAGNPIGKAFPPAGEDG